MKERAYPPRLTTEEGIAGVIRDLELCEWELTFQNSGKLTPALLESHAREVADWRIEELREEHGSLTGAFHTDPVLQEQLTVFETGRIFVKSLNQN